MRMKVFQRLIVSVIAVIFGIMSLAPFAAGEQSEWDCPECGRAGNAGNYCGGCGHPAPWLEFETESKTGTAMSYDEFVSAELDAPVCIEAYVQASQSWWAKDGAGRMSLYLQDENHGGYFAYEVLMEEEESRKLVPGTKVRISGVKAEWSGEVEIIDARYEILEGSFIAEAEDVTALLGTEDLARHINQKIALKDLKVVASKVEGKEEGVAFLYAWDGSGSREGNSDLYFNVEVNGRTYTLTVESYLCGNTTDVYKAVEGLKIGDTIDAEGFLYWYNGANPHITSVTVK